MKFLIAVVSVDFIYCILNANGWCLSNMTPSTSIWVGHTSKHNHYTMPPTNQTCCAWDNENCYVEAKTRHPHNCVTIFIACSKYNHVFTAVEVYAGGFTNVLKSGNVEFDNYVDVFDENGEKRYWYRCGTPDHWEWY